MAAAATAPPPPDARFDVGPPDPDRDPWHPAAVVDRLLRSRALAVSWRDRPRAVLGAGLAVAVMVAVGWWLGRPSSAGPIDGAIPFASAPSSAGAGPAVDGAGSGGSGSTGADAQGPGGGPGPSPGTSAPPVPELVVHVAGAVTRPGIVQLAAGARVVDAIEAAGGAVDDADLDQLNLAAPLADGVQIRVPHQGETVPVPVSPAPAAPGGGAAAGGAPAAPVVVDLNRATAVELEQLPGIGPSLAAAIVTWRTDHGRFDRVDDLLDVPGIGPAKLATLADHVTV